ncbi:hypothetical protein FOA52_000145 [Chlamydomonas sp. UWO 241]|nr:hypothetical protein FOA52_000145 [Chlamydomonas sp. UWO 241]
MVHPAWGALAVPVLVAGGMIRGRGRKGVEEASVSEGGDWDEPRFVCERVCTTDKLLKKVGSFAKDPTPNTCVTVCGTSGAWCRCCVRKK